LPSNPAPAAHEGARDAVGAKVKVTTASGCTLYNHVAISVGFMSSSDKRVHFGLGEESKQVLKDVAADRFLKVEEPPLLGP
jgi:hypothetical protein